VPVSDASNADRRGVLADTGVDAVNLSVLLPAAVAGGLGGILLILLAARSRRANRA